jgi:ubiquitin-conjugating enzyme (huntingtin interacting protein 2)
MNSRIRVEILKFKNDDDITLEVKNDNMKTLIGIIDGPKDSAYEGGKFKVDIYIPDDYPFVPPKMKFITKVWHPNISSVTGAICIDILKEHSWSPALNLKTVLISLQSLLNEPIPDDPQDAVVASQLLSDPELFFQTAKTWTQNYAKIDDIDTEI